MLAVGDCQDGGVLTLAHAGTQMSRYDNENDASGSWQHALEKVAMAKRIKKEPLTIEKILAWADAHHDRTGRWPSQHSGPVYEVARETWDGVNGSLRHGGRGLRGNSSLSKLLARHRGKVPSYHYRPPLTVKQILAWANEHHGRTGRWPGARSGPIPGTVDENWTNIQQALYVGIRGLPGGSSLSKLLKKHHGESAGGRRRRLTIKQILAWADKHHRRTGIWPRPDTGAVIGAPGERWGTIRSALHRGSRGLKSGMTLSKLLWNYRSVISPGYRPNMSLNQILAWADAYHERTGDWPVKAKGSIPELPGTTWNLVREALREAWYGLPAGWTLARLLVERRGAAIGKCSSRLTYQRILKWLDSHHRRTGVWPNKDSGPLLDVPQERWSAIDSALRAGTRGLPGDESLARFLAKHRGISSNARRPLLTFAAILSWASAHHRRTGCWPCTTSGPVAEAPGETWAYIAGALRYGGRGLPKGLTLSDLLAKHHGAPPRGDRRPPLTVKQIVAWVKSYHRRTGEWPRPVEEPLPEAPRETWRRLNYALRNGRRGLPGGMGLRELIVQYCGASNSK